jgi:hypothetical protein
MGFLDKMKQGIKDATGLGLDVQEQYKRAYEKGVLVKDYDAAVKNFLKAADKAQEAGDEETMKHARANAAVYKLLSDHTLGDLRAAIEALGVVPEIEQINTDQESVPTAPWIAELSALEAEVVAFDEEDFAAKRDGFAKAAELYMKVGSAPLAFVDRFREDGPKEKAMERSYYASAYADYIGAQLAAFTAPQSAEDSLHKASMKFRQAKADDGAQMSDEFLEKMKAKRHCWMCGREMQGNETHYYYYPTVSHPYQKELLKSTNDDVGMLDRDGMVTICTVCGNAIEAQADRYAKIRADEVREWAVGQFQRVDSQLSSIESRLSRVESMAHRHSN